MLPITTFLFTSFILPIAEQSTQDSRIVVNPAKVENHITTTMYGSCIEDVNHEIYGGLYAQRIFGESFEEPPSSPVEGWNAYGGQWRLAAGALQVEPDAGAKMVYSEKVIGDGTVSCEMRFDSGDAGNASLILHVSDPHAGPDPWNGYEIGLSPRDQTLIFGRHRNNWEPIRTVPLPMSITTGRWYRLKVEMKGALLRIFVDDNPTPLLEYEDTEHPLITGMVGVRTWNSRASFRNLTITADGKTTSESFGSENRAQQTVSGMWDTIATGRAMQGFTWESGAAYNSSHSQQITHRGGAGTVGISNRGLNRWGIALKQGQPMQGSLYLNNLTGTDAVVVALQSADGNRTYAQQRLTPKGSAWSQQTFALTPSATDANARFAIWLDKAGSVSVDQVYLSETAKNLYGPDQGALFGGLPIRADIGGMLKAEGLTFLRYGGTMVNAPEYRWKKMIGERDKRPQYRGHWYPYSTNGFGIEDFLQFCEASQFEPVFAINIDETPEDAADLVEYLNGPITSVWGAKREANGHPDPYNIHYIQIGNEEGLDNNPDWYRHYLERYKLLYAAMHARDPKLKFVISAWWNQDQPLCKQIAQELSDKAALWDLHVGGDGLRDSDEADRTIAWMQQLFHEWIPNSSMKVCIFEENGNRHDLQRALGHARMLNVTQRYGDFVLMDSPANCLQPLGQNDNGWDQGQVFFTPDKAWGMPPYYAQQMASRNHLPLRVAGETTSPNNDLDVTATRSEDGKTLVLKIVNSAAATHTADIDLGGFVPASGPAEVTTLEGELNAVNTPEAPERVRSVPSQYPVTGSKFSYTFRPYSYTILRLTGEAKAGSVTPVRTSPTATVPGKPRVFTGAGSTSTQNPGSPNKPAFHVEVIARNLEVVWSLVFPSRDLVFLTERPGRVRALQKGQLVTEPLLTLEDVDPTFKLGAMGLALHPEYSRNHWLYLAYSYKTNQGPRVRVVRFKVEEKAIGQKGRQPLTERTVMIENIPAFTNHAGCRLRFGPDKKLYITTGDANQPDMAQHLDSLAGKILRLNDDGTVPKDNPFVGQANARPEIWTYGHRNSQGIDFQPGTNTLFETEHGPTGGDEVNIIERGKNYGWPVAHHDPNQPGMEAPLLVYGVPSLGPGSSVFYKGKAFPEFRGDLFVGCMRSECILRIRLDGSKVISQERLLEKQYGRIREITEGPDGLLYFTTSMRESDGRPIPEYDQILRLVPGGG